MANKVNKLVTATNILEMVLLGASDLIDYKSELKTCNPEFPVVLITGLNGDADEYKLSITDNDDNGIVRLECEDLVEFMHTIARPKLIEEPNASNTHISKLLSCENSL